MRPLETLLALANAFALFARVLPAPSRKWCFPLAGPLVLLAAVLQLLLEGWRWQLVPADALAWILVAVWVRQTLIARPRTRVAAPWRSRIAVVLGALGLALSVGLPMIFPVFRLPAPTGPYAIGTVTYHWVDADRAEAFTATPADRREVMVQVWYPALESSRPRAPYVEDSANLRPLARLLRLPPFALSYLRYVTTNATVGARVAGDQSFPMLVFSHGRGGYRQHNTWQIEELVSHGYAVAAIDHPYAAAGVTFPDGRVAELDPRMTDNAFVDSMVGYLAQDVTFTLKQLAILNKADPLGILTGHLDLARAGVFGLSLGGAISAEACRQESRIRACLTIDVWMPQSVLDGGLRQPTMLMTRDAESMYLEGWPAAAVNRTQDTMQQVFERLPGDGYLVRIHGMFHQDFSDAPLLSPLTRWLGLTGPIPAKRAHEIVSAYTLAFFERHLRFRTARLLDGPAEEYPEVVIETRGRGLSPP